MEAVPSEGGTCWFRAVPLPAAPKGLEDDPKVLVVPAPPWPNNGVELVVDPKAGFAVLAKLKPELPVLLPKALLVLLLLPNPLPEPNPPAVVFELPNSPLPVFDVVEPKGLEAGLLPKREPEAGVLLLNPVDVWVSIVVPRSIDEAPTSRRVK